MALTDFTGVVAVITGGASGIGLATARTLHTNILKMILRKLKSCLAKHISDGFVILVNKRSCGVHSSETSTSFLHSH
jgi:short-subunit dehydrogenase involved in D-alanine esterification of teichoic acids